MTDMTGFSTVRPRSLAAIFLEASTADMGVSKNRGIYQKIDGL